MEFTRENVENICESTKSAVASMGSVIEIIASAAGKPEIKAQVISTIATGVLDAVKPIVCAIADAQNGKDLVPEMEKLVSQLQKLRDNKALPTT